MKSKTKLFAFILLAISLVFASPVYASKVDDNPSSEEVRVPEKKKLGREVLLNEKIPMPIAHQDFLYNQCEAKNIDFKKALAIIRLESGFNEKNVSGNTYGYFQIHEMHHNKLASRHNTAPAPLDPYINIKWGTSLISDLYRTFESEGLTGDKLDRAVLSAFNKGEGGFRRTGEATKFINIYNNNLNWINSKY